MSVHSYELPRSVLHALEPIGLGTPEVESLTSYFCRLANSHACTTNDLTQLIIDKVAPGRWNAHQPDESKSRFVWHERSVSGVGEGALTWASVLSELTGILGLDRLTLLPMRSVLAPKALMALQARWCPNCFDDDQRCGRVPFFRLAWDIGVNKTCLKHRVPLVSNCGHCGRSNVRNNANFVIPGWCTACDHFLGCPEHVGPKQMNAEMDALSLEQSRMIGELLAVSSESSGVGFQADLDSMHSAIERLTENLDGGVCAHFAKRIGMRKSTIHHWKTERSPLTFDAMTRVSMHCNLSLPQLLLGNLSKWQPPSKLRQLGLSLSYSETVGHRALRQHDWATIRNQLKTELESPVVRSLAEIARELDIDDRHLYIQVTDEARMIGERFVQHLHQLARQNELERLKLLREAAKAIREEGDSATVGAVQQVLGKSTVNAVRSLYTTLSEINSALDAVNDDF